jgi:hypothetical protein
MKLTLKKSLLSALILVATFTTVQAEDIPTAKIDPVNVPAAATAASSGSAFSRFFTEGEWYFSWGYSTETWAPTDIRVSQPSEGNDFIVHNVKGHDEPGWTSGIFNKGLFAPQNNIRIGRFIDDEHTVAVELSLDHTKYTSDSGQTARVTGTINGVPVDADKVLDDQYFRYYLHNGANHLMANIVKRVPLIGKTNETFSLAAIGKAGVGVMLPHSDITIMGKSNEDEVGPKKISNFFGTKHGWWQLDGWTAAIEAGVRFVIAKPIYLEVTDKVAYARLFDIPVYHGSANQSLWMNEVIMSLGFTYDGSKKVPKP